MGSGMAKGLKSKRGRWSLKKKMLFGFTVIFLLVQLILIMAATFMMDEFLLYSNYSQFQRVVEAWSEKEVILDEGTLETDLRQELGGFSTIESIEHPRKLREIPDEIMLEVSEFLENKPDQIFLQSSEEEMIFGAMIDDEHWLINVQKMAIVDEMKRLLNMYIGITTLLSFLVLFVCTYFYLGHFVQPILKIKGATHRIALFDFEEKLVVKTNDELEDLANSINSMSAKLQENMNKFVENEVLFSLGETADAHFSENGQHIERVSIMMYRFAHLLGFDEATCDRLKTASTMHDIGKIAIPDHILKKPGKLTEEEFEIMKTHTIVGERILGGSALPTMELARVIALYHHERMDGTGYPQQVSGMDIPECARMMAIVDVYDALTNERVYKKALAKEAAIRILIEGRGQQFDPSLLDVFLNHLEPIVEDL